MKAEPLHVILGMDPEEWEAAMAFGRINPRWGGLPVSADPNYHAHPALGIIGHGHGPTDSARRPHIHRPALDWDWTPVFLPESEAQ